MKILSTTESLKKISDSIDETGGAFFTRYGDNDIMMMSGKDLYGNDLGDTAYGGNKTQFSPELQQDLLRSFTINDAKYLKGLSGGYENEPGMVDGVFASFGYNQVLEDRAKSINDQEEYLSPVLFQYLATFKPDVMKAFVDEYIRGKNILFISGTPVEWGEHVLGDIRFHVETPKTGAYQNIESIYKDVIDIVETEEVDVIIPNCGQCSRVIQGRLYRDGFEGVSLDMGSLFDCWGMPTRTWIRVEGHQVRYNFNRKEIVQ